MGFPRWLSGKVSICQAGDIGSIPESGQSPGEENSNLLHYSWLGNPKDKESGGLYSPWGPRESHMTQWLNNVKWAPEQYLGFPLILLIQSLSQTHSFTTSCLSSNLLDLHSPQSELVTQILFHIEKIVVISKEFPHIPITSINLSGIYN